MKAIRTPAADRDLDEIAWYIAVHERRPRTAERVIDEVIAKCELHAAGPMMGTAMPALCPECRVFAHKRWVVIFRPLRDGIEVLRIVDGARDYDRLFDV
ncbi:MAG: type II toxin-antitoxin system RelE/ParE family toxin [Pirellulales bacterium]